MSDKPDKKNILVPVDFSPYSKAALLKACELATCLNEQLIILHVAHDPSQLPGYYSKIAEKESVIHIEDIAREMLDDFVAETIKSYPGINCLKDAQSILVAGIPVSRIIEVAEKVNASMIVMGSQGRSGLKHVMLGSKAEQVVRLSPIPVTIVKVASTKPGEI